MEKTHIMYRQAYYIDIGAGDINRSVTDRFAAINCAGCHMSRSSFTSYNPTGREDFYLQYLVEGELDISNGKTMRPGDAILYFPHTPYFYHAATDDISYYWVHFSGSAAEEIVSECGFENATLISPGQSEELFDSFEAIFQDFIVRGSLFELSLAQKLIKLLHKLALLCKNDADDDPAASRNGRLIAQVIATMHRSYSRDLTIRELAQSVYISEGYLRAIFKEKLGVSPKKYLTSIRISAAKQLLTQTTMTIEQIAQEVGVGDPLYFSQLFHQNVGRSPSEYRRSERSQ